MAKKKSQPKEKAFKIPAPRFGIGEWYGRSFVNLTTDERRQFAETAIKQTKANAPICPFKPDTEKSQLCSKKGGICCLRLYEWEDNGTASVLNGKDGDLRAVCPHRFKQNGTIYREISLYMIEEPAPRVADEVRFLQRLTSDSMDANAEEIAEAESGEDVEAAKEDVGNIDNVLVHSTDDEKWCALEIQTVYFSGEKMKLLFEHIRDFPYDSMPFPDKNRRPDYRSSGPKRLMPQLQIKVPTLRRWGKKMAVAVDRAWFRTNVVNVESVSHLSNADIAWFLIDYDESTDPATIKIGIPEMQTLERAVEGLTGGSPVTLPEFEAKIVEKLSPKPTKRRRK
jgi:hypothetical protein